MGLWHHVEHLCPVCKEWRPSGAATTPENFRSGGAVAQSEGRFILSCSHEVTVEANQSRLGSEIAGLGRPASPPRRLPERRTGVVERRLLSRRSSAGNGLAELQRQIDHARRRGGRLVVAYVDIDGLKATNETKGHSARDAILKHVVGVVQSHLRSYEPIVRLGGDEFACTMSDATIENVRQRFDEITAKLAAAADNSSISVGFAELVPGDSPMDLINRADAGLIAGRRRNLPITGVVSP